MSRFFVIVVLCIVAGIAVIGWRMSAAADRTDYPPQFSGEKLAAVAYGTLASEVEKAIGRPFTASTTRVVETWLYVCPGNESQMLRRDGHTEEAVINVADGAIEFDGSGHVSNIQVEHVSRDFRKIARGDDKVKVVSVLGEPCVKKPAAVLTTWSYSKPKEADGDWTMVYVVFNEAQRLIDKHQRFIAD